MTNRALVIAALADGRSVVRRPLRSRDTELMVTGLRALGAGITLLDGQWHVDGVGGRPRVITPRIDVGLAGTVARFLPPIAALADAAVHLDGDVRMRERPMAPLLRALRDLGVHVDAAPQDRLPCIVHGAGSVRGGDVVVDASTSSQLVSGLLLAAPYFGEGLVVRHQGPSVPSRPHIDMTIAMMRAAGAGVDGPEPDVWVVRPGGYHARDIEVEPDLSGASAFLAAAVATGGSVAVPGWPESTTQPGRALLDLLTRMGATWTSTRDGMLLTGPKSIAGIDADLRDCPEMTPAIAVLAALAHSASRLTGVAHIRLQETDRIAALAGGLAQLGADVDELPDGLIIRPSRLRGVALQAHDDHRLAMAWAVLGLVVDGITVDDIATTSKTMPDFVERWSAMLASSSAA